MAMTMEDFYKLNEDDMYDCLRGLRLKYHFTNISVVKLKQLTKIIQDGFRPNDLKQYLIGMNRKEGFENDWLETKLREKYGWWTKKQLALLEEENKGEIKNDGNS